MSKLNELLKLDGVVAAGEFAPDGTLVAYKSNSNMSPELAAMSGADFNKLFQALVTT